MLPEDERRLQRERDIASATAGPSSSLYNEDTRSSKAYGSKREAISNDHYQSERAGYYLAVREGRIPPVMGHVPPFRDNPTRRSR